ncbi:MAG: homoserine O-acetyltransferase [Xanthomonadales bacterium]|jgi:homoserine O-acetyltransferase|nr:homoserine O-acetyltransferase [Xanthomonadales bacterium]
MQRATNTRISKRNGTSFLHVEEPFRFFKGGVIPRLDIAFETWGELDAERSNASLVMTGLSPNAHAASSEDNPEDGWWEPMMGPGKPIDTRHNFVVCVNSLGSCKGSTGPASINPETSKEYRLSFPDLTIQDIAAAGKLVLDALGIEQLRCLIGPSMGGMSGLALMQQQPDIARHFLAISTAARAEPFAIAIRSLQREMIVRDPRWQDGGYTDDDWPETGMRLARKLGMISYRSGTEWRERFGRQAQKRYNERLFGMHFAIESYLENAARKFIRNFDPCSYLYLSQAMDLYDFAEGYPDLTAAFAPLKLKSAKIIGVDTDVLWPPHQQREICRGLTAHGVDCDPQLLPSVQGHDAFLVDYDRFCPAVAEYFEQIS